MKRTARFYARERRITWTWQSMDSKSVPAPLGGEETGKNPTDRGKSGSKIHLLVDQRGAPLAVLVSGANQEFFQQPSAWQEKFYLLEPVQVQVVHCGDADV